MTAPLLPARSVAECAIDLIAAAGRLDEIRREADRVAAALEARWAANRARRRRIID